MSGQVQDLRLTALMFYGSNWQPPVPHCGSPQPPWLGGGEQTGSAPPVTGLAGTLISFSSCSLWQ